MSIRDQLIRLNENQTVYVTVKWPRGRVEHFTGKYKGVLHRQHVNGPYHYDYVQLLNEGQRPEISPGHYKIGAGASKILKWVPGESVQSVPVQFITSVIAEL